MSRTSAASSDTIAAFDRDVKSLLSYASVMPSPDGASITKDQYRGALLATAYLDACRQAGWSVETAVRTLISCIDKEPATRPEIHS